LHAGREARLDQVRGDARGARLVGAGGVHDQDSTHECLDFTGNAVADPAKGPREAGLSG
jgi:hypothetical protein